MDSQQFLAEFGHIVKAPNGIAQLRELVLCLAMQGKLIPQNPGESTAAELLLRVEQNRARLISRGAIKSPKPWPEIDPGDISHALPSNWAWVRFGEIAMHNSGKTLDSMRNSGLPRDYITTSNLYWGRFELGNVKKMLIREEELDKCTARKNDLLICEGGEAGRAAVWVADTEVCFQNHVHRARFYGGINPFFAYRFFEKLNCTGEINAHRKGIGISNMSSKALAMIPFPLPPLEEQSRIVAKVDELMALCDKLETQQQDRRKLQNNLRQSTLHAVATASSPPELQTTWTRLAENFGRLFYAAEDVAELRKLILDLAVSGYLTQYNESDESALVLRNRVIQAKTKGIAEGSVVHKKPVKPEELQETVLPGHWESITLDEAISTIDAGWSPACLPSARDDESKWGILKTTSVQILRFLPHEHKELPASLTPKPQYQIEIGDILITRAGPKNRVGICCVVDDAPPRLMISDKLIRFHIVDDLISARFVALCLSAGEPGRILERLKSGMADSQMNISQDKLRAITIPLPPIAEQHRILEKVESMMRIIDGFEEQLRKKEQLGSRLATAAISSITGIATEQEEEPMKAPQTELIAPLRLGKAPDIKVQSPLATILARHNGEMPAKDLWQRFGGEIDAFYAQLKTEVAHGWILEPAMAEMREKRVESADT
jgi:type I restriction enzyme S subunit